MYDNWEKIAKTIVSENSRFWKKNKMVTYMIGNVSLDCAKMYVYMSLRVLTKEQIQHICSLNDKFGDADVQDICGLMISPSSTRYVAHAIDICKHIKHKNMNDVCIVEVGAGYGGLALVLSEVSKIMGVNVVKYVIYDLFGVRQLQKLYLSHHSLPFDVVWKESETFGADLETFDKNFLVSAYCISELTDECRRKYLENLLPKVFGAYFVWNNKSMEYLPANCVISPEIPQTGTVNTIVRF